MNETARILCAIGENEAISATDILVNAQISLLPTSNQVRDLGRTLLTLADLELVTINQSVGQIPSVKLTPLGAERAREVIGSK